MLLLVVALLSADLVAAVAAVARTQRVLTTVLVVVFIFTFRLGFRLYRTRLRLSYCDDLGRALLSIALGFVAAIGTALLLGRPDVTGVAEVALVFLVVSEVGRAVVLRMARFTRRRLGRGMRTIVVGSGEIVLDLVAKMGDHPEIGLRPVAVVDSMPMDLAGPVTHVVDQPLSNAIADHRGQAVILTQDDCATSIVEAAVVADGLGCAVFVLPRAFEIHHDGPDVERLRSYPLVRLRVDPTRRPSWWIKRALDVIVSLGALVVLLPVLCAVALAVLVESGRPILFHQWRVGRGGQLFQIQKFRSLTPADSTDEATRWNIDDDPRLGRVGRFIRSTSLDELPQLWNVVRGDMSLVGPRPERPSFVERFSADLGFYAARHRVPVGLTGLAQVNGLRGDTSIADRARYDNYYIATWSLWLDGRILVETFGEVMRHSRSRTMQ